MEDRRYTTQMNWQGCKCPKKEEKCCPRKEEKCPCQKEEKCTPRMSSNCRGCICQQLRKLELATRLDIFLSGGISFLGVTFISFDPRNCCAYFLEAGAAATSPLIVDCNQIVAIRKLAVA
ncbi:hypothetical protein [Lysinibacillus fusiformis]|uniref:hypothetical protein n=1 Tax=Lysinibacillus fusiformis TaxID=28031 RepID=UPI001E5F0F62|nr:hypothetical protein [Lysinibacillus fusiformis]MCE4044479.1 hypothetical protein [Lysinibacillus fusiformis]MCT6926894.1 hypothetical protein [Lysinibacillus fusiformis]MCT6931229.1 hypothetical protein [Lysinibacillus fusiformis]UXJ67501.1 hypothetical protein N5069_15140 [Lysinibacillus fusiformis]